MSVSKMITLDCGHQVLSVTLIQTILALKSLARNEHIYNLSALVDKCKGDKKIEFTPNELCDPKTTLTKYHLIDEEGRVNEDIGKIVLQSIDEDFLHLIIVDPLKREAFQIHQNRAVGNRE